MVPLLHPFVASSKYCTSPPSHEPNYQFGTKPIVRHGSRDQIMFDSGQKFIWKTAEKAKAQDCEHSFFDRVRNFSSCVCVCVVFFIVCI